MCMCVCFLNHQIHIDIPRMSPESLVLQPKVTEVRGLMVTPHASFHPKARHSIIIHLSVCQTVCLVSISNFFGLEILLRCTGSRMQNSVSFFSGAASNGQTPFLFVLSRCRSVLTCLCSSFFFVSLPCRFTLTYRELILLYLSFNKLLCKR